MPENENITTYPEEPTNPSGYTGFNKSVYYIFSLLRDMYYSKVESENKFYTKNGGTITGSVTIQGNLVVNGQSYSIDTENLKVGDYTITLAKDNEQTLTSMVGMVVPKYDGTNYGFFGWDADGYAYVGDLTNYDGTSAITLANNSSLQRISTIDTTNTVVASNGVIYVYDATSHCFKKPTNDNKYYVIRNGAFVETELFTEQKSKNIDNALYNLGAFDTISGNVVSRGHWRLTKKDFKKQDGGWFASAMAPSSSADRGVSANITFPYQYSYSFSSSHWYFESGAYAFCVSNDDIDNIVIDYKTIDTYQEDIIPNTPLLDLDSNGCNFLREEWEKGLNLFNKDDGNLVYGIGYEPSPTSSVGSDWVKVSWIKVEKNTTYSVNKNVRYSFYNGSSWSAIGDSNTTSFTTNNDTEYLMLMEYRGGTQTADTSKTAWANLMLNTGNHAYPYQEYNGAIVREKDIAPNWYNPTLNTNVMSSGNISCVVVNGIAYVNVWDLSATNIINTNGQTIISGLPAPKNSPSILLQCNDGSSCRFNIQSSGALILLYDEMKKGTGSTQYYGSFAYPTNVL